MSRMICGHSAVLITCLLLLLLIGISGCGPDEREVEYPLQNKAYFFDPQSPSDSQQWVNALTPTTRLVVKPLYKPDADPVSWGQQRFINAIQMLAQDEIQRNAQIASVFFAVSCEYVDFGPQQMSISYYRFGEASGKHLRIETEVAIDAQAGYIDIEQAGYAPPTPSLEHVDRLDLYIPAEKALREMEEKGGAEFRKKTGNNCLIRGVLSHDQWRIAYEAQDDEINKRFELYLNALGK